MSTGVSDAAVSSDTSATVHTVIDAVAGQYVVTFRDTVSPADVATRANLLVAGVGGVVTNVYLHALRGFAARLSPAGADAIAEDPTVQSVEQDGRVRAASAPVPVSWGLDRLDQSTRPLDGLYQHNTSGAGVHAYVVDSGVRADAAEFGDRIATGVQRAASADPSCDDHGTDVAAMLGGTASGAAPGVTLVPVGVLECGGGGSVSELLAGIDWITANAMTPAVTIVSATAPASNALDAAVQQAIATGIVVVTAAGNDAADACTSSPARVPDVLTIAASDSNDRRAPFSNFGSCIDFFAPGVDIPSMARPGSTVSGTSIAAAYTAGVAARFLERRPDATPAQAATALADHATPNAVTDAGENTAGLLLSTEFIDAMAPNPPSTIPPTASTSTTTTTLPTSTTTTSPPASTAPPDTNGTAAAPGPASAAVAAGDGSSGFVRAADGQLWWRQLTSAGWWAWQSFGGAIVGSPSVVSTSSGVYVFARGIDNGLWYQRYDGTRWSGWQTLGGVLSDDPAAVTNGTEISVFIRGSDNGLYWRRFSTGWSDWQVGLGILTSAPVATADADGFHVFIAGLGGGLWTQNVTGGSGTGWNFLGLSQLGAPSATTDSSGVSVFIRGLDSAVYRRRLTNGTWHDWQNLGGIVLATPAVTSTANTTTIFAPGIDHGAYQLRLTGDTSTGWSPLGGYVVTLAAATTTNGITLFAANAATLYAKTFTTTWTDWTPLDGIPLTNGPTALSAPEIANAPTGPPAGLGFDACEAPSTSAMSAWRHFSPFTSAGVYIGGVNRACRNRALDSPAWVQTVFTQGWQLIPIYVGLQAPCISFNSAQISRDLFTALSQGSASADDAVNRALAAGLPPGAPVYFDMEGYNNSDSGCVVAVRGFMATWTSQLHARGFRSGMYSSQCSGIRDLAALYNDPSYPRLDAIWIAAWNDRPNIFGFGPPCAINDSFWPFHQRIHQYQGGHNESYGGVTINIDRNAVDGPLAP